MDFSGPVVILTVYGMADKCKIIYYSYEANLYCLLGLLLCLLRTNRETRYQTQAQSITKQQNYFTDKFMTLTKSVNKNNPR